MTSALTKDLAPHKKNHASLNRTQETTSRTEQRKQHQETEKRGDC